MISVSSFGAQVSPSRTLAVATIFVHGTRIQISVLIVPELAAPIRNSVHVQLHAIPHLQNLPLATADENFDISVLIGQTIIGTLFKTTQSVAMGQPLSSQSLGVFYLAHSSCCSPWLLVFVLQSRIGLVSLEVRTRF